MKINKLYSIEKSPFYRLRNRRKLANLLGLPDDYFNKDHEYNYSEYSKTKENGNGIRTFSVPSKDIKNIQDKLYNLLKRIETPQWLMSGKENCSYITNATLHLENYNVRTMDISKFYDSTPSGIIYKMFKQKFLVEHDIARILTKLVTYQGYLPTGSSTSQLITYWAYSDMFHEIYEIAQNNEYKFSLYVDDMAFSSKYHIPRTFRDNISAVLTIYGLHAKLSKDHYYQRSDFKVITGVGIKEGKVLVSNKKRQKIIELYKECRKNNDIYKIEQLKSMLLTLRQLEPTIFPEIYNYVTVYNVELSKIASKRNKKY